MATWEDISKFRCDDLASLNLTWDDLNQLSFEQLLTLAEIRVKKIHPKTEKDTAIKELLLSVIAQISASLALDAIKSVNWSNVLKSIIQFVQNNF